MSEEEKQAIEKMQYTIEINQNILDGIEIDEQVIKSMETTLNLIDKQQKEIENLKFKYQTRKDRTKVIIEGLQEELEENENKYDDFTTVYLQGVYDGKKNLKYKIKELIEEKAKTDTYNFRTIAVKDIEELLGE